LSRCRKAPTSKGYRGEAAREKANTIKTYWVPGVNNLETLGRWDFAEFTEVYKIEADFEKHVESNFEQMIENALDADGRIVAETDIASVTVSLLRMNRNPTSQSNIPIQHVSEGRSTSNMAKKKSNQEEIGRDSAACRPFPKPKSDRIAVKVINHFGDEVMKVFRVSEALK